MAEVPHGGGHHGPGTGRAACLRARGARGTSGWPSLTRPGRREMQVDPGCSRPTGARPRSVGSPWPEWPVWLRVRVEAGSGHGDHGGQGRSRGRGPWSEGGDRAGVRAPGSPKEGLTGLPGSSPTEGGCSTGTRSGGGALSVSPSPPHLTGPLLCPQCRFSQDRSLPVSS